MRDALILTSRYPGHSLGLLALGILLGFAAAYLGLALLLFLPSVHGLFITANCLLALDLETQQAVRQCCPMPSIQDPATRSLHGATR